MEKNNKKRLLCLIEILQKNTNENKHLSLNDIATLLEEKGIGVSNRKTLYDDFKILNEFNYNVEYDNGYYLLEAPFNLSEIKIIQDSIYSLKNLDTKLLDNLNQKLYSFISFDDEKLLDKLKYTNKHKNRLLLQRMEDVLLAIKENRAINIKKNNGKREDIFPLFIYRSNDYYYFYYHYRNNEHIYHYRFDNILDLKLMDEIDEINISRKKIIDTIEASSNSFYKGKSELINILADNSNTNIESRIADDFPNAIKTKNGYSIKASINNNFFAKLVAYGNEIKISDKAIAKKYKKYLEDIIKLY